MTSTRLPGKVLADIDGEPMLARLIARMKRSRMLDAIAVATTTNSADDPVAALGRSVGLAVHRGDEEDVLGRYVGAARETGADLVVRVTADCPLLAPEVLDLVVGRLESARCDYASNTLRRTFPRGLDVEAMPLDTLLRVRRLAASRAAREHVTYFVHSERPDLFLIASVEDDEDHSDLRWTVDTPEDLAAVRAIFAALGPDPAAASYASVLEVVRRHPEITRMNASVEQKRF
jgi:spore coat polysaccharide biosynthesis protein SpsF